MKAESIPNPELAHFLKRSDTRTYEVDLSAIFIEILRRANDFVPSEVGAILLDYPDEEGEVEDLVVVASVGGSTRRSVGMRINLEKNRPVVKAYRDGEVCRFYEEMNLDDSWSIQPGTGPYSTLCAPLLLEGTVIGVVELVNLRGGKPHEDRDVEMLKLFAHTISASVANAVEAQRSKEMAQRDELTGLFNDRYLHHAIGRSVRERLHTPEDCGLIFLDLDRFKMVNDVHGHLVGSRVLMEMGSLLRQVLPGDAIPGRYGGDEFVVIIPQASRQEIYWAAETIRQTVAGTFFMERADEKEPLIYPALALTITCSVGVAALKSDIMPRYTDPDQPDPLIKNEWIRLADTRMYQAKDDGRNRIVFDGIEIKSGFAL